MTPSLWLLVIISQAALVGGQIFLKRAMTRREQADPGGWLGTLALGIATMTIWFLLWLGAMHRLDLSQQMPLEGLSPLFIVFGSIFFLGERLNWKGWLGVALTSLGVVLVSAS